MAADWKTKYMDIRAKLLRSTDVAYRLGYEDGMKAAAQQQMQQQAEQQAMMEQAMQQGGMPGQEGEMPPEAQEEMQGQMPPEEAQGEEMADMQMPEDEMESEGGSELDQHIDELSSLVAKGEKPSIKSMRKAVEKIADIRKSQKSRKKVEETLVPSQKRFVDNIIKKWEKEVQGESDDDITKLLEEYGYTEE